MSQHGGPQINVYVDRPKWDRWTDLLKKKEGKSASQKIREFVEIDIARLEGVQGEVAPPDYASARRAYLKIIKERDKLRAGLKKAKVYDELSELAKELGFDVQSCENVDEVAAGILERWKGPAELVHQFIILMEKAREQRELETKLRKKENGKVAQRGRSGWMK